MRDTNPRPWDLSKGMDEIVLQQRNMNTSPKVAQLSGVQPRLGQDSAEMVCAPRLLRLSLPLNRAPLVFPISLIRIARKPSANVPRNFVSGHWSYFYEKIDQHCYSRLVSFVFFAMLWNSLSLDSSRVSTKPVDEFKTVRVRRG